MTYRERDRLGLWLSIFLLACLAARPVAGIFAALVAVFIARGLNDWFHAHGGGR